jgi:hypothetical protein
MKQYCKSLLIFLFTLTALTLLEQGSVLAQNKKKGFDPAKMFFGGGLGLQFGDPTFIEISPIAGYRFTDRFAPGVGVVYEYLSFKRHNVATSVYGGKAFASYVVIENLFLHTEYEVLSLETEYFDYLFKYTGQERFFVGSFFVGGGYRVPMGSRSFSTIMVLWNLNETVYSPYQNPVFRLSFQF